MVVELKNESVTYFVGIKTVKVESKDPNVDNNDSNASPGGKISLK